MSNADYQEEQGQQERLPLDERQVGELREQVLGSPIQYPPGLRAFVEDIVRQVALTSMPKVTQEILRVVFPTGFMRVVPEDLTAQTGLYLWEGDETGEWIYCNGATLTATYQDLIDYLGTSTLPDLRGRAPMFCGTHADMDLWDNDGVAESSRRAQHQHTESLSGSSAGLSITGSPGGTFVTAVNVTNDTQFIEGATNFVKSLTAPTGSPTAGTLDVAGTVSISGTVGAGMDASDKIAHQVIGSLLIRP